MSAVVRILPSGHQFLVESGEPLLQAALRSGLALEFGCSNGGCGECKARVIQGEVRRIRFHDYVIKESEKSQGTVLLCCSTAESDLTIEAGEAGGPEDIPLQEVRAKLYKEERVGANTVVAHLRVMRGRMLRFLAGQHVRLTPTGGQGADVSIASCPCDGMNLEFHFDTRAEDPLSARAMAGFGKSQRFEIEGPRGRFILDESSARPLLFLAADTAIAPIKSIIEHAINLELTQPMALCWQTSSSDGHYLHNYFRSLGDALDDFRYLPITGTLDAATLSAVSHAGGIDAYVAGPEIFVTRCRELLLAGGLPENRLFVDALNRRPAPAPGAD